MAFVSMGPTIWASAFLMVKKLLSLSLDKKLLESNLVSESNIELHESNLLDFI